MTRRERLERKVEKRREWAEKRQGKAAAGFKVGDEHRDPTTGRMDWALVTQPGHIPERARINRAHERAGEHLKMANHHESRAAGLEDALERSIFSDDADAIEQLEKRAAEHEAQAEHHVAVNKAWRKTDKNQDQASRLTRLVEWNVISKEEGLAIAKMFGMCHWEKQPYPAYVNANLRNRIRADRERIKGVKARAEATAAAEAAGGVVVYRHPDYDVCQVTFAEKPDRAVLDALRAAGFHWGGGSWAGPTSKLPSEVTSMEGAK